MDWVEEFYYELCQGSCNTIIELLQNGKISLEEATELSVKEYIEFHDRDYRDRLRQIFKDYYIQGVEIFLTRITNPRPV